jgi:hypothetical protein
MWFCTANLLLLLCWYSLCIPVMFVLFTVPTHTMQRLASWAMCTVAWGAVLTFLHESYTNVAHSVLSKSVFEHPRKAPPFIALLA